MEMRMTMKPVYYLCGPIDTAGQKEKNIENFKVSTAYLKALGYTVRSPVELGTEGGTYLDFVRRDIELLLKCNGIILLRGWAQSKGARGELNIAMYLNMKVFYFDLDNVEHLIDMNFPEV